MTKSQLKPKLDELRRDQEFFRDFNLDETTGMTMANIDLQSYELNISYNPDWLDVVMDKKTEQYLRKKNIPQDQALEVLLSDTFIHEIGHRGTRRYKGCPATALKLAEKFITPIQEVTGWQDKGKLHKFTNSLIDDINNTIIKRVNSQEGITDLAGLYLFFKEQGKLMEREGGGQFHKLFESHVRLNLYLNGDKHDHRLVREYLTYDEEVNVAIKNFLHKTGISEMKRGLELGEHTVFVKDKERIREYLMDEDNWENIAKIYAEEFAKFMDEPPIERLFGAGGCLGEDDECPGGGSSGAEGSGAASGEEEGTGSSEKGDSGNDNRPGGNGMQESGQETGQEEGGKFPSGDGFGDELNTLIMKKKVIANGIKAGKEPGWMTNFEYLECLYEILAEDKIFELIAPKMESKIYPLIDLNERSFDYEEDSPRDIIGFHYDADNKGLELTVGKYKYNIEAKVRKEVCNRPDLVFAMLDTSSSMQWDMPKGAPLGKVVNPRAPNGQQWRYNSKYHVALITYFMAVQRFDELNVHEADAYFANFSSSTILSQGLKQSKLEALHPQFGGTQVEMKKVSELLEKRNSLIFTISDGEIGNWGNLFGKMKEIAEYNPCFHVQIGEHSAYSRGLLEKGLFVKQVIEEKELYDFVIDLTDTLYG